ncbi:MAG: VWA domain-containing protein [Planctomycetota bacterium]|nr:VWA domain-containing protein [Planctomycetota bacterium]
MTRVFHTFPLMVIFALTLANPGVALAQVPSWSEGILTPQLGCRYKKSAGPVRLLSVASKVRLIEQVALTTVTLRVHNSAGAASAVDLMMPVASGATIRTARASPGKDLKAALLNEEASRRAWLRASRWTSSSTFVEFYGFNQIFVPSVSLPPKATILITIQYEQILMRVDSQRLDYVLPRSESNDQIPWTLDFRVTSSKAIAAIYSPSHKLSIARNGVGTFVAKLGKRSGLEPGPIRISTLLAKEDSVSATLFTYPNEKNGGTFLFFAGVPKKTKAMKARSQRREITFVLDRSGSMRGSKLIQAKEAALQIIAGLKDGERFNVIDYSHSIDSFRGAPVIKNDKSIQAAERYLNGMKARGGTNLSDALNVALAAKPANGFLPIILFLTDGVPTLGVSEEQELLTLSKDSNQFGHRIFTIGIGFDVNAPLLNNIAVQSRAQSVFVTPGRSIELTVAKLFRQLEGPVLSSPKIEFFEASGQRSSRCSALRPSQLPDLFEGDQLIILGRYRGTKPLMVKVSGNFCGEKADFRFRFRLDSKDRRFNFVPRLWASRQIGFLIECIRRLGSAPESAEGVATVHLEELVDEVIYLSKKFGILTEYTAFLAKETTDLSKNDQLNAVARKNFIDRAIKTRSGRSAVNQELNVNAQKKQSQLNYKNWHCDKSLNRVALGGVKKFSDRAFYRRNGSWIDSRLVESPIKLSKSKVILFGSREYKELVKELSTGREQGCLSLPGDIYIKVGSDVFKIQSLTNKKE